MYVHDILFDVFDLNCFIRTFFKKNINCAVEAKQGWEALSMEQGESRALRALGLLLDPSVSGYPFRIGGVYAKELRLASSDE